MKTTFGYTTGQLVAQYLRLCKERAEYRQRAAQCEAEIQTFERLPADVFEDVKRRACPFVPEAL